MNSTIDNPTQHTEPTTRVPRLQVEALAKTYGTDSKSVEVIENLSFSVKAGEMVCIVGPSGVGKTTLLKCLAGLHSCSGGSMKIDGKVVSGPPAEMALVFQDYSRSLMPWLTVEKTCAYPSAPAPSRDGGQRPSGSGPRRSRFEPRRKALSWQLSGGMQQRVAIARALAYRPEILIMDEPFASVDAQTRFELEDLCLKIRDELGMTILLVTHDIDEAVYLSDRIVAIGHKPATVLNHGRGPSAVP